MVGKQMLAYFKKVTSHPMDITYSTEGEIVFILTELPLLFVLSLCINLVDSVQQVINYI